MKEREREREGVNFGRVEKRILAAVGSGLRSVKEVQAVGWLL
jgi:hypothetical protein